MLNGEILNIPPKIRNKGKAPAFITLIQHCLKSPSQRNKARKKKQKKIWKEKIKSVIIYGLDDCLHRKHKGILKKKKLVE